MGDPEKTDIKMEKPTKSAEEMFTIEELAEKLQVKPWVMAGLKVAYKWGTGKVMTEKDFIAKREAWCKGPVCRN